MRQHLSLLQRVWRAVAMEVGLDAGFGHHIDVGIDATVGGIGVAYLQDPGRAAGFVDQVVAVGVAGLEGGAFTGAQNLLAGVGDQGQLTLHHPDEFVVVTVPVTLA